MGAFSILDHTADVRLLARGPTFGEALANVGLAMFNVIIENMAAVECRRSSSLSVVSSDREALVVDWLNELLYLYAAEGFVPCRFQVRVGEDGCSLLAACGGETLDRSRHRTGTEVKAATYHGLNVSHDDGEWSVHVVLDV